MTAITMSHDEIREIAEEAADKAVRKMFLAFGLDLADPKEIIAFQDDLRHVRVWRESTEAAKRHALKTVIGVLITGALGYIALLFQWHR